MHTSNEHKQNETVLEYLNSQLIRQCHMPDNLEIITYLLKQGADINAVAIENDKYHDYDEYGRYDGLTPLIAAVKQHNNFTTIKFLVEHGAHVNPQEDIDWTPLNEAVDKSDMVLIKYLIDNGAKVTKSDIDIALDKNNNTTIIDYLQSF